MWELIRPCGSTSVDSPFLDLLIDDRSDFIYLLSVFLLPPESLLLPDMTWVASLTTEAEKVVVWGELDSTTRKSQNLKNCILIEMVNLIWWLVP